MVNLQILEELRTRKEVEDYFKKLGKEITDKELDALKQSYDKAQENSGALTMQQLDDVAGGTPPKPKTLLPYDSYKIENLGGKITDYLSPFISNPTLRKYLTSAIQSLNLDEVAEELNQNAFHIAYIEYREEQNIPNLTLMEFYHHFIEGMPKVEEKGHKFYDDAMKEMGNALILDAILKGATDMF